MRTLAAIQVKIRARLRIEDDTIEKRDYAILSGIALLAIIVGAFATNRPLGEYLVSGTIETANTAVTMAWIT